MERMTPAQKRALGLLWNSPLTDTAQVVHRVQLRTLRHLSDAGLAKYRPYGKPPAWKITAAGRKLHARLEG